ncbi:MAG: hypothetical protein ACK4N5_03415 [Myxococcales bacterium]
MNVQTERVGRVVVTAAMFCLLSGFDPGGCGPIDQPPTQCGEVMCDMFCEHGFQKDPATGCEMCVCNDPPPPGDRCQGLDEQSCIANSACEPQYSAPPPADFCMPMPGSYVGCKSRQTQGCSDVMCTMYCEYGFQKDTNGCEICACNPAPQCSPVMCKMYCEYGFQKDPNTGCEICACNPPPKCDAVMCKMYCEYGFQRDPSTGCEICACNPPPTCSGVVCDMYCEYGFQKDANGCEICACNPAPQCQPLTCRMYCPYGLEQDANGCDICQCKPGPSCSTNADCKLGQVCEQGVTCAGLNCPPPQSYCRDVECTSDAQCAAGSSCQPDPNDPCNQPNVLCFAPGRNICQPAKRSCETIGDEATCSATPGCKPLWKSPDCPPGMACPAIVHFSCESECKSLGESACLARKDCSAVYGPSACSSDGTCTTDMQFKHCQ